MQDKTPNDPLFTVLKPTGRWARVTAGQVNNLFRAMGAPEGVTVHKLRTARGTHVWNELMNEALEKKPPKDEKTAMAVFKKLAEAVGKILNHVRRGAGGQKVTGTTALNAYIDPSAQLYFWNSLGFRIPKYLEKYDLTKVEG
jgi:hypothetical protein